MSEFDNQNVDLFGRINNFNDDEASVEFSDDFFINEDIDPDTISLSQFKIKKNLNGKIWNENQKMADSVRARLLVIANDFWDSCNIKYTAPEDIIMVGSLANYNWSKNSDIDLHLVVDFSKVNDNKEFVEEYFKDKKNLWNNDHADILIHKFPVELYVQDVNEEPESAAIYSVLKNKWIDAPVKDALGTLTNKASIKKKAAEFMDHVDAFEAEYDKTNDPDELQNLELRLTSLIANLRNKRKKALAADGEMSDDNIIYKILRRNGYIDKIYALYKSIFNQRLSL